MCSTSFLCSAQRIRIACDLYGSEWFFIIYAVAFPRVICHTHNKITLNEAKAGIPTSFDYELKITVYAERLRFSRMHSHIENIQILRATGSHDGKDSTTNIQRLLEKEWWKNSNTFPWSIFSNNFQENWVSNNTSNCHSLDMRIRCTNV